MIPRRINIYVPGILTFPGSSNNWSGKAVTFTHTSSDFRAEKVEYLSGPGFTRSVFQRHRARKLTKTIKFYARQWAGDSRAWNIRLVGHSNGCDVILDALREWFVPPTIEQLHLVCPACDSDFERNGLNQLLRDNRIGHVCIYIAGRDSALRIARSVGALFGYGTLGLSGATNVATPAKHKITTIAADHWTEYGHSDCWADFAFDKTMAHFIAE